VFGILEESRGTGKYGMVCHMAKDHFAYIGAYRECIDEVEQLKKEMWNIIMDSKAEMYNRIQASRELHNLSKTFVLLLRDLPFVTNLSKFYDKDMLNASHINSVYSKGTYSNKNDLEIPGSTHLSMKMRRGGPSFNNHDIRNFAPSLSRSISISHRESEEVRWQ